MMTMTERPCVPMIERTLMVQFPNGETDRVDRFTYNLAMCANPEKYLQTLDQKVWIRARVLTVLGPGEPDCYDDAHSRRCLTHYDLY